MDGLIRDERERELSLCYDGPIPPAELAAAKCGPGAYARLQRGADGALLMRQAAFLRRQAERQPERRDELLAQAKLYEERAK